MLGFSCRAREGASRAAALMAASVSCVSVLSLASAASAAGPQGYYRQPTLRGNTIVFAAEGDLWKVQVAGGSASRLTTHAGEEGNPAISPDGTTVAFTAQYEGPTEVYTMPLDGGLPVRRTWGALRTTFVGWSPDGKLLYSTREYCTLPSAQIARIDLASGTEDLLPLAEADQGAMGPDGTLFFTRLPFQGSYTKRYKGGFIQQLWRFDPGAAEAVPLTTDYAGTSKEVMVGGGRIYFASDRDGVMNLWSSLPDGKDLKQLTRHADFDVASPEFDAGRIVYQHGADLYLLDEASGQAGPVQITLASDFDQTRERWVNNPQRFITSSSVSADGSRLAIAARGRVFVAPAKQGRFVEVTRAGGVRYRTVKFMPDGKTLLALSDRSGEVEFWTLPANGVGDATQITSGATVLRWEGVPSPDGKWVAHHDKDLKMFLTRMPDAPAKGDQAEAKGEQGIAVGEPAPGGWGPGETRVISQSKMDNFQTPSWSPDSRWLVFAEYADNLVYVITLYDTRTGTTTRLTTDRFDSASPKFSPGGEWLYFLSDRNIRSVVDSPWGPMAPQPFFDKKTKIYAMALKAGLRNPWQAKDELTPEDEKKDEKKKEEPSKTEPAKTEPGKTEPGEPGKPEPRPETSGDAKDAEKKDDAKKDDKKEDKKPKPVEIELEGIQARLIEVPVKPGNYGNLSVNEKALFFMSSEAGEEKANLLGVAISSEKVEVKTVQSEVTGYELSADGKKLAIRKEAKFFITDASPAPADLGEKGVDLAGWTLSYEPAGEWKQMYADAWRLLRDYFYAPNMHGVDWKSVRAKYEPLVARVRSRAELNDVLAQVTGELSTLHHFVRGGDIRQGEDRVGLASLGARLVRDQGAGGYRVEHIYEYDPDEVGDVPPLARQGVDVKEGDVIVRINGTDTLSAPDVAALLRNQAGKQVLMTVKPAAAPATTRDVIVVPVSSAGDDNLRYNAWEVTRRRLTETMSDGQIGYVHLRAMGGENIAEWAKGYYPVFNRQGLIIDVRRNRGGNIDSWILGQLLRRPWMFWSQRVGQQPLWNIQYAFRGHVVVLCDSFTASDGEAFSEGFKRLGLGKVIGTRTWGGEVWLSSSNVLADEGLASAGEYGVFGPEKIWIVEGHGVDPDIVVDNPPHATFKGEDAQLKAAVEYLKKMIAEKPVPPVEAPAWPDKSFKR
jgi:tricorn protease